MSRKEEPYLPLRNALDKYSARNAARFHMPGHKGRLSPHDVTEISGTDNLRMPTGAIDELEKNCAEFFGARDCLLLVNGSTVGNLACMLMIGSGKHVLVARNCHCSVLNGIALAGHSVASVYPDKYGIVTSKAVAEVLDSEKEQGRSCAAVVITSPTYYGAVCDIESIARVTHERGILLFVDAAHGAHFGCANELPRTPHHADAWVVSCHKTLNALTQSAVLNLGESCPYSAAKVRAVLNRVQTTSPSYLLMSSVENAVVTAHGWGEHIARILSFRRKLEKLKGIALFDGGKRFDHDVTRLVIMPRGMSGYELGRMLEDRNIFAEMSDISAVVLITSPNDPNEWYDRLYAALSDICLDDNVNRIPILFDAVVNSKTAADIRTVMLGEKDLLPIEAAEGRICAGAVGAYPPGVATLFPGEIITAEAISLIYDLRRAGAEIFGMMEGMVEVCIEDTNGRGSLK